MIADAILNLVFAVLDAVTGLLPTFTAPFVYVGSDIEGAIGDVSQNFNYMQGWVDVNLLVSVMVALAAAYVIAGGVFGVLWVYHHIPGKGT